MSEAEISSLIVLARTMVAAGACLAASAGFLLAALCRFEALAPVARQVDELHSEMVASRAAEDPHRC